MTQQDRKGDSQQQQLDLERPAAEFEPVETVARYRLALVREEDTPYAGELLSHPAAMARFVHLVLGDRPQEHMIAVYLDTRNRAIGWTIAHIGTLNRAAVEPRHLRPVP